jgi:Zn-dependent protease
MESAPTNETLTPERPAKPGSAGEDDAVRYESSQDAPAPPQEDESPQLVYAWRVPLILLLLSAASMFVAGCCRWAPMDVLINECFPAGGNEFSDFMPLRVAVLQEWRTGLMFLVCMLSILLAHEFGHFIMTIVYRVRATLPLVIPFPISPIGTMGAVIAMEPGKANRREIFDIGIAGPLAGLAIAVPVLYVGLLRIDWQAPPAGIWAMRPPLLMEWWLRWLHPTHWQPGQEIWFSQANPYLIAGFFGLFFTGLNMFPVGQLDGGHITYTLLGKRAHLLARGLMVLSFAYMAFTGNTLLILMAVLVMLMGTDHPPTSDDSVPLGWPRVVLGWASLIIPIVCLTPDFIVHA